MSSAKWRPFCPDLNELTLIPAWITNHMPSKESAENTYPLTTWTAASLKFGNGMSDFILHFLMV